MHQRIRQRIASFPPPLDRRHHDDRIVHQHPPQPQQRHQAEHAQIEAEHQVPQDRAHQPEGNHAHHHQRSPVAREYPGQHDVDAPQGHNRGHPEVGQRRILLFRPPLKPYRHTVLLPDRADNTLFLQGANNLPAGRNRGIEVRRHCDLAHAVSAPDLSEAHPPAQVHNLRKRRLLA